ncbi:MAG: 2-dehydro-3-deoxygalactonokinase [Pseudomonadota bacterium]
MSADWIAVDWGTSSLRAWAVGQDGIVAEASSSDGMSTLDRDGFEPVLLSLVGDWLGDAVTPVIACGMVGARQGWAEAPYVPVPCPPMVADGCITVAAADPRIDVRIIPGLSQDAPADVMRGEETQIAGFLASESGFSGTICLPGTHTKWVQVGAGRLTGFQTMMTGELFALLSKHSVLRHSVGGAAWDDDAFIAAVRDGKANPDKLAGALFALRAEDLLHGLAPASARARLSGLLIGAELAAASFDGGDVAVIGAASLGQHYATGLSVIGRKARIIDGAGITLAGLTQAWHALEGTFA